LHECPVHSPKLPPTFWSYNYSVPFIRKKAALPPLGLLTVAAMLPDQWPKRFVDFNVDTLAGEDLAWADCAFVSAMAIQRSSAHQVIALCREAGLVIVAGGPLFTIEPELCSEAEHVVLNEDMRPMLLPALIEWRQDKKGLPFNTEVSIKRADDPELMALMVAAGFNSVFAGIETHEDASLMECNKSQNRRRDLMASVKRIQRAGLQVQGGVHRGV